MNTPSLNGGNWRWRFDEGQVNGEPAAKLALLADLSDRTPKLTEPKQPETFFA